MFMMWLRKAYESEGNDVIESPPNTSTPSPTPRARPRMVMDALTSLGGEGSRPA